MAANKRNYTLDLYRFVLIAILALMRIGYFGGYAGAEGVTLLGLGSMMGTAFFFLVSGYFLTMEFRRMKEKGIVEKLAASNVACIVFLKKVIRMFPVMVLGWLGSFLVQHIVFYKTGFKGIWNNFWTSSGEWLGLEALYPSAGYRTPSFGAEAEALDGTLLQTYNPTVWYLSALLIACFVIAWLLAKHEDLVKFMVPFGAAGFVCLWGISKPNVPMMFAGICATLVGAGLYDVINYFRDKKFTTSGKIVMTIFHVLIVTSTIYYSLYGGTVANSTMCILFFLWAIIALIGNDYVTDAFNFKFNGILGRLSLYMYLGNFPTVLSVLGLGLHKEWNYPVTCVAVIGINIVVAILFMIIDEKILVPFAKKHINPVIEHLSKT